MSREFLDRMLEQSKAGELRSPVSGTLEMHLVEFGRAGSYAGFPRAWNALATMKTSLERFDEPQDQESRP
jgi:hypothetical protein